jgi:hypothetical protein
MMLVKRAFFNRIETLALRYPRRLEVLGTDLAGDQTIEQAFEAVLPPVQEVMTAVVLLRSAPKEITRLFTLLIDDALELTGHRRLGRTPFARRETTNQMFCRLLGIEDTPIRELVESHFLSK